MVHLRDTPNALREPSSRQAPEVNAWNVDEIQMGKYQQADGYLRDPSYL